MVCTFGDATDVQWWREEGLPLRQVVGRDGRLVAGGVRQRGLPEPGPRPRRTGLRAARRAAPCGGAEDDRGAAARPRRLVRRRRRAPRCVAEPEPIEHPVKFYEKGDRPLEFITTRQWFVRLLEHKQELIDAGEPVALAPRLHAPALPQLDGEPPARLVHQPPALLRRARSRCGTRCARTGRRDYSRPILADEASLPVDPMTDVPPGYAEAQRDQPGRLHRRGRRLRHLVHVLAHAADRDRLDRGARAPPAAVPDGPAAAEPRDHPDLGLLHDRQGLAARADRSRGATWRSPAGCSTPTARRCRRARATW